MPGVDIVLTGVGGQGIITLATLIANAALEAGLDAVVAETHGLSQRGGTVIVHVRIGERVEAPLVPRGGADLLIALEPLEALRYIDYLKPNGVLLINKYLIPPPLPGIEVPSAEEVVEKIRGEVEARGGRVVAVNATRKAVDLGDARVANTYLLGVALGLNAFKDVLGVEHVERALRGIGKLVDKNIEALRTGIGDAKKLGKVTGGSS